MRQSAWEGVRGMVVGVPPNTTVACIPLGVEVTKRSGGGW